MHTLFADIRRGIVISLTFLLCTFSIVYAAISWPSSAPSGEVDGGKYNTKLVPSGAVMAFYLSACPTGWSAANGAGSTPDLRGTFVRGIWGETNSRDIARVLGEYQVDEFKLHSHGIGSMLVMTNGATWGPVSVGGSLDNSWGTTSPRGWIETRPKNVSLLYCVKN